MTHTPEPMQTCDFCKKPERALVLIERTNTTLCYQCKRNLREAAPSLLEALVASDAALRHHPNGDNRSDEDIAAARAAIAKARGGEHGQG